MTTYCISTTESLSSIISVILHYIDSLAQMTPTSRLWEHSARLHEEMEHSESFVLFPSQSNKSAQISPLPSPNQSDPQQTQQSHNSAVYRGHWQLSYPSMHHTLCPTLWGTEAPLFQNKSLNHLPAWDLCNLSKVESSETMHKTFFR